MFASLPLEMNVNPDHLWGYLASCLVLATFATRSMRRLRVIAILGNIAFIYYASALGLLPILILHSVLLPLNAWRLVELRRAEATVVPSTIEPFFEVVRQRVPVQRTGRTLAARLRHARVRRSVARVDARLRSPSRS